MGKNIWVYGGGGGLILLYATAATNLGAPGVGVSNTTPGGGSIHFISSPLIKNILHNIGPAGPVNSCASIYQHNRGQGI